MTQGGGRSGWIMFALLAVGVVGLMGLFATYAAPLPLQRALAREAALDQALAAAQTPDPAAALAALAPELDDSAPALAGPAAGLPARIAAERLAMRARFLRESDSLAVRLRLLVGVVTAMAGLFVALIIGGFTRRA